MSPVAGPIANDAWVQNARRGRTNPKTSGTTDLPTRISSRQLDSIQLRLSPSDHQTLVLVRALRLISGNQLSRLFSVGEGSGDGKARVMRRRLEQLTEWRLLDRLPRAAGGPGGGSSAWIYCLGPAGNRLLTRQGITSRRMRAPGARFVDHTLAIAELFVRLMEASESGQIEFLGWDAEPDCWREFTASFGARCTLRPDLFVRVGAGDLDEEQWHIEVDRATETLPTILSKCRRYLAYMRSGQARADGPAPRVLWTVPTTERAERLREAIATLPPGDREVFTVVRYEEAIDFIADEAQL